MVPPLKYTEKELVQLLNKKDNSAFGYLYDNYSASLYGVVFKILDKDQETAQNVFQEIFIKICNSIVAFDPSKGTLFTWMLNVTRNTALLKKKSFMLNSIHSINNNVNTDDNQDYYNLVREKTGVLEIAKPLKTDYKTIIDMAYFGGYVQNEISVKLNIPPDTVKTQMHVALAEFRRIFAK
jgi:RNA polymerase sigma-70 factor (ECF subfamily)